MRKLFLCIFLCFIVLVSAQTQVTGTIQNKLLKEPIERASVYISGTTSCTYTNKDGFFKLENVKTPCQLVVSHLGYELKVINLKADGQSDFVIYLTEKEQHLQEVTIVSQSRRKENIKAFRDAFLGTDSWGVKAKLLNDSDLIFERQEDSILLPSMDKVIRKSASKDSAAEFGAVNFKKKTITTFIVTSRAPLLVDLPLLGYTLSVDLKQFVQSSADLKSYCSIVGYFLFKEYAITSKSKQNAYERNRRKVYYNSALHFMRSLYANKLKENGYVVFNTQIFVPDSLLSYQENDEAVIKNQKGKDFRIYYIAHGNGMPINLREEKIYIVPNGGLFLGKYSDNIDTQAASWVRFKDEKCKITKRGVTSDNTILFQGYIGDKKVGALLPEDYDPEEGNKMMNANTAKNK